MAIVFLMQEKYVAQIKAAILAVSQAPSPRGWEVLTPSQRSVKAGATRKLNRVCKEAGIDVVKAYETYGFAAIND